MVIGSLPMGGGRRTRGHSWCHITAVTELCPSGEQCGRCPLQPLTPRVLELPPQFPSLPFLSWRSRHVHPLTCCLQHLVLGFFVVFFFQAELNQNHPIALGVHPHSQHLNICSLICRRAHGNLWFSPFLTFFSFHSLGTTTDPCSVPWFCGKQAHGQGVGGLRWSTFVGWPDSGLCSQGMERGWDTGTYWIFGVTASQCSVSHLKHPLGCYIKVLQLQEPPCTKGWLSPSWWPWMGWIDLSSMHCGAIPNTHWYVITSTCCW